MEAFCGIDFGSSNTKVVLYEKNNHFFTKGMSKTKYNYLEAFKKAFKIAHSSFYNRYPNYRIIETCVTGYGRITFPFRNVESEIICHSQAVKHFFPNTMTVLDLGGQDFKAISIDSKGKIKSFQMNDRCAAGCGRHIEYTARALNLSLNKLSAIAFSSKKKVSLNLECAVFSGAEALEFLFHGEKKEDIVASLLEGVAKKAISLLNRNGGVNSELTITGGVSENDFVIKMIRNAIGEANVFPFSYYSGAIGAALLASYFKKTHINDVIKNVDNEVGFWFQ